MPSRSQIADQERQLSLFDGHRDRLCQSLHFCRLPSQQAAPCMPTRAPFQNEAIPSTSTFGVDEPGYIGEIVRGSCVRESTCSRPQAPWPHDSFRRTQRAAACAPRGNCERQPGPLGAHDRQLRRFTFCNPTASRTAVSVCARARRPHRVCRCHGAAYIAVPTVGSSAVIASHYRIAEDESRSSNRL